MKLSMCPDQYTPYGAVYIPRSKYSILNRVCTQIRVGVQIRILKNEAENYQDQISPYGVKYVSTSK